MVQQQDAELGKTRHGDCLFLEDNRCTIHTDQGAFAKPAVCQLYPLSLARTPDGYYLSLTFSCPSVVMGGGQPLEEQLQAVVQTLDDSALYEENCLPPDIEIQLTACRATDWPDYLDLEPAMLRALLGERPIESCLRLAAGLVDLSLAERPLWEPPTCSTESLRRTTQALPLLTAGAMAILEHTDDVANRDLFCRKALKGEPQRSRLLKCPLPPLQYLEGVDDDSRVTVRRFLENFVRGKRLLQGGSVLARLLALAVSLSILNFYYAVGTQVSPGSPGAHGYLAWCFDLIETEILGHSDRFMPLFQTLENRLLMPEQARLR